MTLRNKRLIKRLETLKNIHSHRPKVIKSLDEQIKNLSK